MHEKNFELLQEEAVRLIAVESEFLSDLGKIPGLVSESNHGEKQTFDKVSISQTIDILNGEKLKLQNREIVIAVVGTMKAGKSTTINAIVGSEILPNRSLPMTALPTLIRHTPGITDPVLLLNNFDVLNEYLINLKQHLKASEAEQLPVSFEVQQEKMDLVGFTQHDVAFVAEYAGHKNICDLLRKLNDMVRIGILAGLPFPFDKFGKINEIPVIEVEFAHLADYGPSYGKLTLLDTPGPNEFGQHHLKLMLKDQLEKASAVLTVLDFTQLKSEADDEVRRQLQSIYQQCQDRLFVLVNKIDQHDRNSDSIEDIKSYIANHLMDKAVSPEMVYPVSASKAFLACKAMKELSLKDNLDPNHSWVVDFAKLAFGEYWQKMLGSNDVVKDVANDMWHKAGFIAPLQDIIRQSHAKAGFLSLVSAIQKIVLTAQDLENYLQVRQSGLRISADALSAQTDNLINDIERLSQIRQNTSTKILEAQRQLEDACKLTFELAKDEVISDVSRYFEEGKAQEKLRYEAENNKSLPSVSDSFKNQDEADFDPSNPVIKFKLQDDAKALISKIRQRLADIVSEKQEHLRSKLWADLTLFESELTNAVTKDCTELLQGITENLAQNDFKVALRLPDVRFLESVSLLPAVGVKDIQENSEPIFWKRPKDSVIAKILNWVNSDWGMESLSGTSFFYTVDIAKVNENIISELDSWFNDVYSNLGENLFTPLTSEVEALFRELTTSIEHIRADLMQSIQDQQRSKAEQEELLEYLDKYLKKLKPINADIKGLDGDLKPLACIAALQRDDNKIGNDVKTLSSVDTRE